jgi:cytochrome P450
VSVTFSYTDDHTLPPLEWHARSRAWCGEMRAHQPVFYSEEYGWLVFSHRHTLQVFSDYATYSSEYAMSPTREQEEGRSIISMDPPRHQQLRSLLTQAMSARTIAQMEPRIQQIADELLTRMAAKAEVDFMADLANPLPVMVIAELLGLPREDWPLFKQWTDAQVQGKAEQDGSHQMLTSYFFQHVEQRRKHPDQSLLSRLLDAEVEGKRLTHAELFSFFLTLLVAGNVTTTNLLGNAMLCFHLFPDALAHLRENQALTVSAIEEVLRYMPPSRVLAHDPIGSRLAKKDAELGGQTIHAGETVRPIIPSANFDEQQFADPERFDIERQPNRHASFGHGIHFCLGAPLARLEARVVLSEMLKRFPQWEIDDPAHLPQIDTELLFGVAHLPMHFQSI